MQLKKTLCYTLFILLSGFTYAQDESAVLAYIDKYKELAITEQLRSGVPAAITLAQGIHESTAGQSELATIGNNHFGIKCKSTWMGETMLHDDDKKQECFRKYTNSEQSYIDHSDFLKGNNRYHFLFDLELTDYAAWASGLKRAGYATNPLYVKKLTDVIEKYNLQQYTYQGISRSNTVKREIIPNEDAPRNLTHVDDPSTYYKGLKGFWAKKGEMLLPKAMEKNIRYAKLLTLNDLRDAPLESDMFVFTERKRRTGTSEFHIVREGENMLMISQKEAMLLDNLYLYNNMIPGQEPVVGEKLNLQYRSYETPKIKQKFLDPLEEKKVVVPALVRANEQKKLEEDRLAEQQRIAEEKRLLEEARLQEQKDEEERQRMAAEEYKKQEEARIAEEQRKEQERLEAERIAKEKQDLEAKKQELNTAVSIEKPHVVEPLQSSEILSEEKARLMDEKLSTKPIETNIEQFSIPQPSVAQITPSTQADLHPEEATIPVSVQRKYDDEGVDDSVKMLKQRLDLMVYSPRTVRKPDTTKKVIPAPQKITAPNPKQDKNSKPEIKKPDDKKSNVQVTKTGIKRDLKKTSEKEEQAKDAKNKKKSPKADDDNKKGKKNGKEQDKKGSTKDGKDKKKKDTSKTNKKEDVKKGKATNKKK